MAEVTIDNEVYALVFAMAGEAGQPVEQMLHILVLNGLSYTGSLCLDGNGDTGCSAALFERIQETTRRRQYGAALELHTPLLFREPI